MVYKKSLTINILNVVGDSFCIEETDGLKVFELIRKAFAEKRKLTLSFLNVEILTAAFLNAAIGQLYNYYAKEFIKEYLMVEALSVSGAALLKRMVNTAKLYYQDPQAMQRSIDEIMKNECL